MMNGVSRRPWALAGKELKMFFLDPQMLFFSLALPLVLVFLMVAAFGGQTEFNATAYVVDLDQGEAGAELVRRLGAVPEISVELLSEEALDKRLSTSNILAGVVIPYGFSRTLASGEVPELIVRRRGTGGLEGQIITSYAAGLVRELAGEKIVAERVSLSLEAMGRPEPRAVVDAKVAELFAQHRENLSLTAVEKSVGAQTNAVAIFLPGLVTMFTLFSITLTSVNIVNERRNGTLERLTTTRLSRSELLVGTWLGTSARGLTQVVFFFTLAWLVFRIFTPASFMAVLVFASLAVVSVASLGLVIASLSRTAEQANWTAVLLTMAMSVLGGSFFEIPSSGGVLGVLSRLTYNYWANDGLRRLIVRGETLTSPALLQDMAVLLGIALVGWTAALVFYRTREDTR